MLLKKKGMISVRKTVILFCSLILFMLLSDTSYAMKVPKTQGTFVIRGVTIIDIRSGELKPDRAVVIEGNKIKQIVNRADVSIPSNVYVVEAKGKYMIPGLWDMHIHILDNYKVAFPSLLANGVTGVRDMGARFEQISQWENEMEKGALAPRIVYSGPILDGAPLPLHENIQTVQEAREKVRELKQAGVDFIKVYSYLPADIYTAIVDEAKKQEMTVAGHVPNSIGAYRASNLGQKSLEHLHGISIAASDIEEKILNAPPSYRDAPFAADLQAIGQHNEKKEQILFDTFKKNNTWQVPTLVTFKSLINTSPDERSRYVPTEVQANWIKVQEHMKTSNDYREQLNAAEKIFNAHLALAGRMHKAGVPILAGTDANMFEGEALPNLFYGFSLHDELELLVQAGMTPLEALQSATIHPAAYLNMTDTLGTIEEGKLADMVLLNDNPLADINHIRNIESVVSNGHLIEKENLRKMLKTYPAPASWSKNKPSALYPIRNIGEEIGAVVRFDENTRTVSVRKNKYSLEFQLNAKEYTWNGEHYSLNEPIHVINGNAMITEELAQALRNWGTE
ncbi:amidohydrolase family protein [Paenibacillus ehimensis]|uniref:amidohydrolase family protein n=1 Tax=Paenibacillus ehimensis TaxID=79264 RepID=UPI000472E157|nr:amidohydrolase family protein [Paenibacillus ehimensis]